MTGARFSPDPYLNEKNEQEKNGENDPIVLMKVWYSVSCD